MFREDHAWIVSIVILNELTKKAVKYIVIGIVNIIIPKQVIRVMILINSI